MDDCEFEHRWYGRLPIKGVAFLHDDSVRIVSGEHRGAAGSVISLEAKDPEPRYLIELSDGTDAYVLQSELVQANAGDPVAAIKHVQTWFSSQCDGEWEHSFGIQIETLDNPRWLVTIDLQGSGLPTEDASIVSDMEDERAWLDCQISEGTFRGAGGPHMLAAILETFWRWAVTPSKPAPLVALNELPLADHGREEHALSLFDLDLSPEEFAARHGHEFAMYSFD